MFGLNFLDLLIGLFLVYFVFAVVASALTEVVASLFSMRAENLAHGIRIMLQDDEQAREAFYAHPAITALSPPGRKPSYIPADVVARVYLAIADVEEGVESRLSETTRQRIAQALDAYVGPEVERLKALFNTTMDRAVGWYRRRTQYIVMGFAVLVVAVSNADTIMMVNSLWQDPTAREQLVALAEQQPQGQDAQAAEQLRDSIESRESLAGLGILGWDGSDADSPRAVPDAVLPWVSKAIGLGITVGAVSMGAPFWFSMMGKLLKARAGLTGKHPDDAPAGT